MTASRLFGNLRAMRPRNSQNFRKFLEFSLLIVGVGGCGEKEPPVPLPAPAPSASARPPEPIAHIPVGKFLAGSRPGDAGRQPKYEPSERSVELGPFRIDTRLQRDEGGQIRRAKSAKDAEAYCATANGRLCSDLEWQRACRGPTSDRYPGGKDAPGPGHRSGFDVEELGTSLEWTRSSFGEGSEARGRAVVVGAPADAPPEGRRCAARRPEPEDETLLAFRCCYGAPNALSLDEPRSTEPYRPFELGVDELKKLLASDERTKGLAENATLFKAEAAETVLNKGPGESKGFTLTTGALLWNPSPGSEYLVVAGRAGEKTSFVLAYSLLGAERRLAGSFLMKNEPGPVALAYAPSIRPRLHFSTCFGCPGETGKVLFREPEELVLLQP